MFLNAAILGASVTFILNLIWENAQAFLFKGYTGFWQHLWICTAATFGDVPIVAFIYAAVGLSWRDAGWYRRGRAQHYLAAAVFGTAVAAAIEYFALRTGRWSYDGMPRIPYTPVGVVPVLQMTVIPPLTFICMKLAARRV